MSSAQAPISPRRRLHPLWAIPLLLLAIVLFALAAVATVVATPMGTRWALRQGLAFAPDVSVGQIDGSLVSELHLEDIHLRDSAGVWLSLDQVTLAWQPSALLAGKLDIDSLALGHLRLDRPPVAAPAAAATETTAETTDASPLSPELIGLLRRVSIRAVSLADLELGEVWIGQPAHLTLNGGILSEAFGAWTLSLNGQRLEGGTSLDLKATLHPAMLADTRLHAELIFHEPQGGLISQLAGVPGLPALSVTLNGDGPLKDWDGRLYIEADGLMALTGTVGIVGHQNPRSLRLDSTLTPGSSLDPALQQLLARSLTLTVSGSPEAVDLTLLSEGQQTAVDSLTAKAHLDLKDGVTATLSTTASGFNPALAERLDLNADASIRADGSVQGQTSLTLTAPNSGVAAADALLGPLATFSTRYHLGASTLSLSELRFDGGNGQGIQINGQSTLTLATQALAADLAVRLPTLTPVLASVGVTGRGSLDIPLQISGTASAPQVKGTLTGSAIEAEGIPVSELSLPFEASPTAISLQQARLMVAGIAAELAAQVDLSTPQPKIQAQMRASLQQPDALRQTTGVTVAANTLTADLTVTPTPNGQAKLTLNGKTIRITPAGGEPVMLQSLAINATVDDLLTAPAAKASVDAQGLTVGGQSIQNVTLQAIRTAKGAIQATVAVAGQQPHPLALTLALAWPGQPQAPLTVQTLDARFDRHRLRSTAPWSVALPGMGASDGWSLNNARLAVDSGSLSLDGGVKAGAIRLTIAADTLPLSLADIAVPAFPLQGTLSTRLSLQGPLARNGQGIRGTWSLASSDIAAPETGLKGIQLALSGTIAGQQMTAGGQIRGFGNTPATLSASLPLSFDSSGIPTVPSNRPLKADLAWSGDLGRLWALVPLDGHRLSGEMEVQASVSGTLAKPVFSGSAHARKGRYENGEWGTVLSALTLDASVQEDGQITAALNGTDGGKGQLKGSLRFVPQKGASPLVEADFTAQQAAVVRRDDLQASIDAAIQYRGSLSEGSVSGKVTTRGAEVRLNNRLGGGVRTLPVRELHRASAGLPPLQTVEEKSGDTHIALAVTVDIPGQIFVRGNGLESEWKGNLAINGTAAAPVVVGDLSVVRGTIDLIGKTFTFTKGIVAFQGGERIDPALTIVTSNTGSDLTAQVEIGGFASKPTLSLTSSPALPQDEVLSRVLFGRKPGQLSAGQAISLAQAAASMASFNSGGGGSKGGLLSGGLDITGMLRSSLGLDVVSFGGGGSSDSSSSDSTSAASVEVGKYVADGVYVGVEQGASAGSSGVKVEVQLTPRVSVETKASGAAGADVGLNYKFDY